MTTKPAIPNPDANQTVAKRLRYAPDLRCSPSRLHLLRALTMVLNAHTSYPHTHTYVLKLHRDAAPREGRIIGRLEHVESGHQFHFNTAEELIACLASDTSDDTSQSQESQT